MMLDSHAETPAQPALALVVGVALEVVVVVALAEDVVAAFVDDETDDVAGAPLDPVSAALTAWSYLPFAVSQSSARPDVLRDRLADAPYA
jgi:hypothetical protein